MFRMLCQPLALPTVNAYLFTCCLIVYLDDDAIDSLDSQTCRRGLFTCSYVIDGNEKESWKERKIGEERYFVSQFLNRLGSKVDSLFEKWSQLRLLYDFFTRKVQNIENFLIINLIAIVKQCTYFYVFPWFTNKIRFYDSVSRSKHFSRKNGAHPVGWNLGPVSQ